MHVWVIFVCKSWDLLCFFFFHYASSFFIGVLYIISLTMVYCDAIVELQNATTYCVFYFIKINFCYWLCFYHLISFHYSILWTIIRRSAMNRVIVVSFFYFIRYDDDASSCNIPEVVCIMIKFYGIYYRKFCNTIILFLENDELFV